MSREKIKSLALQGSGYFDLLARHSITEDFPKSQKMLIGNVERTIREIKKEIQNHKARVGKKK